MKTSSKTLLRFLLLAAAATTTAGQFSCTLTATDEPSCLDTTSDDGSGHCVWCAVASFGFCVTENQAESFEQNIPGIACDRYSGNDDDEAATDDDATPTPNYDEAPSPNDDALPDNYWLCLNKKSSDTCLAEGCTWCDCKAGF